MLFKFINAVRQTGVGAKSGKAYDFTIAQGLIQTKHGLQMCEVMLPSDHPPLTAGRDYVVEIELYPDREKRLTMRVVGLALPASVAKAV